MLKEAEINHYEDDQTDLAPGEYFLDYEEREDGIYVYFALVCLEELEPPKSKKQKAKMRVAEVTSESWASLRSAFRSLGATAPPHEEGVEVRKLCR